jgi:predicted amidohydrolase
VRNVRVASVSFTGVGKFNTIRGTIEGNVREMVKLLERVCICDKPDIVCFPEHSPTIGLSLEDGVKTAEENPGEIFSKIAPTARKYGVYVVCPMYEKKNGHIYNAAVLIGRDGEYVGSYYKIHPTIDEIEGGITPGVEPKTFKTDFGTIGFAICFDLNFEDVIKGSVENGAELILFPTMYRGGLQLKIWAFKYGVYFASAFAGEGSMIVDPLGRTLAVSSLHSPIICKTINLDYEILHIDYNWKKWDSIKEKYGLNVEIDISSPEGVFMLISNLKNVNVKDIIYEFQLETRKEYFHRSIKIREEALKKEDPVKPIL